MENCALPIDVILKSSDDFTFGGHITNLHLFSDGFVPGPIGDRPISSKIETADYQEKGEVLRILLRFMHREVPPDLRSLPFSVLKEVAEAAHKYIVFHAIPYCNIMMG